MRVYLAGPWVRRDEVRAAREHVRAAGFTVDCRWIDFDATQHDENAEVVMSREALNDVEDILESDALMVLNLEKSEGKAVEQGIAFSRGIPVVVVGPFSNVFQRLQGFARVDTLEEGLAVLKVKKAQARIIRGIIRDELLGERIGR